jgi:hypothetical protein
LRIVKLFINKCCLLTLVSFFSAVTLAWDVDLSRRVKTTAPSGVDELNWPSSLKSAEELFSGTPVQEIFTSVEPAQSIVILNTERGFVPETIRIRKDGNYKIYITNVNEQMKNSSFILDSFGQTHGTYFGKPKSFDVVPKINGIFTFLCPESGAQGKFVVYSDKETPSPVAMTKSGTKK